jgi:signal transduction histidine kinase
MAGVVSLAGRQYLLTLRLVEQDRNFGIQRSHERLGQIADLAVAQLAGSMSEWDLSLLGLNSLPPTESLLDRLPGGATFVLISRGSVSVYPQRPLLFTPESPSAPAPDATLFDAADALEIREEDYDGAIAALQALAQKPATRPEALLRIARIEHKMGREDAALNAYKSLSGETAINSSGTPYALLAASARCRLLRELGRMQESSIEAEAIRANLLAGRWPIRREVFEYYWSKLNNSGIDREEPPSAAMEFAVLVSDLYDGLEGAQARRFPARGRKCLQDSSLVMWNAAPNRLTALVTRPDWLSLNLKLPANSGDIRWKLLPTGTSSGASVGVTRSLAESQLPGRLEFSSSGPDAPPFNPWYNFLLGGSTVALILILGSGYVIYRALSREIRVAQLQSDFVAAVSHEFRSPLTTLRTITELLAQNRITAESHRQQSYIYLDRETMRLHRLVEDLLDFGRMESGRKQYRMEAHDAFHLVRATVEDFSEQAAANGFRVESDPGLSEGALEARIQVDEEAFRRAFRNLLDNAMKYSPVCRTVWVDGALEEHHVLISVRDQGMGIDGAERQAIFQKFVRGHAAKKAGINGTGIGLAMVQQICEAMGGEIRLQSEAGVGSTFTLVLPLAED